MYTRDTNISEYFGIVGMMWESREVRDPRNGEPILVGKHIKLAQFSNFQVRIGIHSGSVVAGVVGVDKPTYKRYYSN